MKATTERLPEFDGGRFTNLELVAEGRQAQVYRADEPFLRRTVALKIVRSPTVDAEVVELAERLHIEGVASTAVAHPNLVRVHSGSFTEDGDAYLVMEWLDGKNVADTIRDDGSFSVAHALDVAIDVAHALDALHSCGIVHADVKPENIILTVTGTTKLIDLGQAHVRDLPGTAEPRDLLGSPLYVCPRYASTGLPDPRSDIFSLAATLCAMIIGLADDVPAAEGCMMVDSATTLRARRLPSIDSLREKVAPGLASAIERALAPDPDHRFATVRQFLEVLCEHRRVLHPDAADQALVPPPEAGEFPTVGFGLCALELVAANSPVQEATPFALDEYDRNPVESELVSAGSTEDNASVPRTLVAAARLFDALLDATRRDVVPASVWRMHEIKGQAGSGLQLEPGEAIQKALVFDADTPPVLESIRRLLEAETPVSQVIAAQPETRDVAEARPQKRAWSTLPWGTGARSLGGVHRPVRERSLSGPSTLPFGTPAMRERSLAAPHQHALAVRVSEDPAEFEEPASGMFQTPVYEQALVRPIQEMSTGQVSGTLIQFGRRDKKDSLTMRGPVELAPFDIPPESRESVPSTQVVARWPCVREREVSVLSRYWPLAVAAGSAIALANWFSVWSASHSVAARAPSAVVAASAVAASGVAASAVSASAPIARIASAEPAGSAPSAMESEVAHPEPAISASSSPLPSTVRPLKHLERAADRSSYQKLPLQVPGAKLEKLDFDLSELVEPWPKSHHQPQELAKKPPAPSAPKHHPFTSLHTSK